jgi:hypothetical protein
MVPLVSSDAGGAAIMPGLIPGMAGLFAALLQETAGDVTVPGASAEHPHKGESQKANGSNEDGRAEAKDVGGDADSATPVSIVPVVIAIPLKESESKPAEDESGGNLASVPELPARGVESKAAPKPQKGIADKQQQNVSNQFDGGEVDSVGQGQSPLVEAQGFGTTSMKRETAPEISPVVPAAEPVAKQEGEAKSALDSPKIPPAGDPGQAVSVPEGVKSIPVKVEANKAAVPDARRPGNEKDGAEPKVTMATVLREARVVMDSTAGSSDANEGRNVPPPAAVNGSTMMTAIDAAEKRNIPPVALNTERLVEHLGGAEMKFTVRMNESGQVQVTTNVHDRTMQVGIVAERAETAASLRSDVPYLENRLRGQAVELGDVKISMNQTATMNSGYSGEQRSRQEWRIPTPAFAAAGGQETLEAEESVRFRAGNEGAILGWLA